MKKNKMQKNNSNAKAKNSNKVNAKAKENSKVCNSNDKNIGFDENDNNSFELR